jgi:hypothetical protein
MTSERQAYVHVQLPGTLATVPAALLKVEKLRDGTFVGRFRYGDRYLERKDAIAFDPFNFHSGTPSTNSPGSRAFPAPCATPAPTHGDGA